MLTPLSAGDAGRVRQLCEEADYTEEGLIDSVGTLIAPPHYHQDFHELLRKTDEPTQLNCLLRWFLLGTPVEMAVAREAVPDWFLTTCEQCGLLTVRDQYFTPAVLLTPCEGLWIAADVHTPLDMTNGFEPVLPVNQPALHLLNLAVRRSVRATLDVCSGSAVHALVAASFSDRVVATDLSPRAQMIAEFNTALNGRANLECLTGDMYSTVTGRSFDLILCNPPYSISPKAGFLYRDNPMDLDEFCRQLVRESANHLNEGGYCQIICEWVQVMGQTWQDRLKEWLEGTGCDVWVLQANLQLPHTYTLGRAREAGISDATRLQQWCEQWANYFRDQNVEAVLGGLIMMRRRQGRNWISMDQLNGQIHQPIGDAVLQGFSNRDFLSENASDERLLHATPRVSPAAILEQSSRWSKGEWQASSVVVRIEEGVPSIIGIDENIRDILACFDGRHSVAHVIQQLAERLGESKIAVQLECLRMVRLMIEKGVLLPMARERT